VVRWQGKRDKIAFFNPAISSFSVGPGHGNMLMRYLPALASVCWKNCCVISLRVWSSEYEWRRSTSGNQRGVLLFDDITAAHRGITGAHGSRTSTYRAMVLAGTSFTVFARWVSCRVRGEMFLYLAYFSYGRCFSSARKIFKAIAAIWRGKCSFHQAP
jgi:hypothetical protein